MCVPAVGQANVLPCKALTPWQAPPSTFNCIAVCMYCERRKDGRFCHLQTLRRCRPMETYAPWFYMVLKAARVAVTILQMLANEVRISRLSLHRAEMAVTEVATGAVRGANAACGASELTADEVANAQVRASKLSFADVVKRLAALDPALPTFIAKQVRRLAFRRRSGCEHLLARRCFVVLGLAACARSMSCSLF